VNQTCGVDPNGNWRVLPASATLTTNDPSTNQPWDPSASPPDAFAEVFCPAGAASSTATTATVSDTYSPSWVAYSSGNCIMKASDLLSTGFAIQYWDYDPLDPNDPVTAKGTFKPSEAEFVAGFITLSGSGLVTARINLVKQ
jgi:hypothetical protein